MIHDIVGREDIPSAVRLNATSRQLGILFGPAVGGAMMLWFGAPAGLLINALIYVPLTLWLMLVPYTGHLREGAPARRGSDGATSSTSFAKSLKTAPIMTMVILGGAASLFVGNAFQTHMPGFAHDLGTEKADFAYSALLAASAAGAVFGGFVLEGKALAPPRSRRPSSARFFGAGWWPCSRFPPVIPCRSRCYLLPALLNFAFYSIAQAIVQLEAPMHLRGRLIGLFSMSAFGLRAFSGVTVGFVGGLIGIHWSLAISAMVSLAVTLALFGFAQQRQTAAEPG